MSVKIISRTTQQQLADTGTSVGLNGNVGDYQRIILDVAVSVDAKTSTSLSITVNTDNTWTLSSGTWAQLGFEVGDAITGTLNQTQISTSTNTATAISVTVNAISGNVMTVSAAIFVTIPSNFIVPSTNGDYVLNWMEVKVDKNFTALDLYYNQYLSSITPTLNSFLDGTQSIASASGLDAADIINTTVMSVNNPKSGLNLLKASIIGLGKTSGVSSFRITITTIVGGFYDVTTDIENDTNPTWFAGSENLDDAVKIDFFKAVGNLDAQQLSNIFNWAGNTGWFNENRNVNNGALTLNVGSLSFQDVLGSNFVTGLQSDRNTRVRFFIDAPSNFFVLEDQVFNVGIITCPIDRQQFTGNGFTELENLVANTMGVEQSYPFAGAVTASIAGFENSLGAEVKIERYWFKWITATRAEIQIDIEPNAQMTSYINSQNNGDRLWALWVSCVDSSGTLMSARRENVMLSGQWLEQVIEPDTLKGGELFEIYPREGDYYNAPAGMTSNTIITEDDFQGAMRFELDKNEHITNVKCGVEIYDPNDGSRYELDSILQNTTSAPVSNDGTQQVDFEINRPFNYVNGFKNKLFTINRFPALDAADDRGFEIVAAMRFRYEWWLANTNLPTAFFDSAQPLNNLNNEWFTKLAGTLQVRYFQEVTTTNNFYFDAKTLTAINYRDALDDGFTNDITIYENDDFTGSLYVADKTNNYTGREFALIDGEPAYLEAKIGKAGATFAHNYVEITLEVEDGQGYLSQWKLRSDQTPTATNPLRPVAGETTVKITNPANELVAQCWIDTNLLPNNVIDLKITAEFQGVNEGGEGANSYFNRDIAWASINEKPAPEPDEDCEPNQCDYKSPVFASLLNPLDNYKNDIKGLFAKRNTFVNDINFFLIDCDGNEYALDDNTYGTLFPFGSFTYEPDLKIYQLRWNSVLDLLGAGCYQIRRQVTTIRGGEINFYSCFYDLQPYECEAVEGTIRIESLHNEYNEQLGINFKDINFIDHIRFSGYFGFEQPIHESTMFVGTNNKKKTNQIDLKSEFTLTSQLVPHKCVTQPLWSFHFMASELFISDYNLYNHRKYVSFAVYLEEVTSADYFHGNTNAHMIVKFSERTIPRRVRTCVGDRPLPALSDSYVYQNQCPIVPTPMVVDFTADKVEVEIGEDVTFTDATTETPTEWAWDFGDSTTSDLQNPVKNWATTGTFDIRLLAAKIGLGGFAEKLAYINVIIKNPLQIFGANLYDWWDYTDESTQTITGGLIDSITSKGTNAAVFASSGTERPASIVGVNGLKVADFDGVNDFMEVAASTGMYNFLHNGSLGTVILINRIADLNPDNSQVFLGNNDVNPSEIGYSTSFDNRSSLSRIKRINEVITRGASGLVVQNLSTDNYYLTQQYNITISKIDANASPVADRSIITNNGGAELKNNVSTNAPSVSNASDNMTIGKRSTTNDLYLKGQIPEVIILKDIHPTPTQVTQLNNYYTNKYGSSFPIV